MSITKRQRREEIIKKFVLKNSAKSLSIMKRFTSDLFVI